MDVAKGTGQRSPCLMNGRHVWFNKRYHRSLLQLTETVPLHKYAHKRARVHVFTFLINDCTLNYAGNHFSTLQSQYSRFTDPILNFLMPPNLLPANSKAGCIHPQYFYLSKQKSCTTTVSTIFVCACPQTIMTDVQSALPGLAADCCRPGQKLVLLAQR